MALPLLPGWRHDGRELRKKKEQYPLMGDEAKIGVSRESSLIDYLRVTISYPSLWIVAGVGPTVQKSQTRKQVADILQEQHNVNIKALEEEFTLLILSVQANVSTNPSLQFELGIGQAGALSEYGARASITPAQASSIGSEIENAVYEAMQDLSYHRNYILSTVHKEDSHDMFYLVRGGYVDESNQRSPWWRW